MEKNRTVSLWTKTEPNRLNPKSSGPLLVQIHERLKTWKVKQKGKRLCWCDKHDNTLVSARSIHCDGNSYVLSAVSTKYAQYHTYVTFETKKEVTELFECQVIALVTDNEKRCSTQGRMLMTLKKCGFCSHLLNLLGQDVSPAQVINRIVV